LAGPVSTYRGLVLGETVTSSLFLGAAFAVLAAGGAGAGAAVGGGGTCLVDAFLCPPQAVNSSRPAATTVRSGSRVLSLFSAASPTPCSRPALSACPRQPAGPWSSFPVPVERP